MKFLKYLQEEFFASTKTKSSFGGQEELLTIFKNPDRSEMKEAGEDGVIRFLADFQHSNFYIWNALLGTHENIIKKFNLPLTSYCRGSGNLHPSGKLNKIEGECIKTTSQTINSAKSWLSKYVDYNSFEVGVVY